MSTPVHWRAIHASSLNAMAWMSGALFSFCFMAVAARELSHGINTLEILFGRSLVGLVGSIGLIVGTGQWALFRTEKIKFHIGRNLLHYFGQYGWFLGVSLLPLAQVFAIEFTSPLWTTLLAAVFLGEALTLKRVFAVVLGFTGVYVIVNPGQGMMNIGALYVLLAAVCFSSGNIFTKRLVQTDNPLTILFFMSVIQLPMGLALSYTSLTMPEGLQWLWLLVVGLSSMTSHFCMARAMQTTDISVVVTLDFLRLPLITLVGVLVYAEAFHPIMVLGSLMVLGANLINVYRPKEDLGL
jgi:drug/metabolite transporter (DMT)-like permease